ncbi:MAG: DNA polymerase III subunit beta [Lentisphaerae bacterium GWF2_45_14]|nr:MAG: DNA polymerase III subunit beta [Lentisphaerae bacterium GWF2_45_14]
MKIEIEAKELAVALRQVSKGIKKVKSLPVLNSVLIEARSLSSRMSCTNLDIRNMIEMPSATTTEPGKAVVNRAVLEKILKFIDPNEVVNISTNERMTTIKAGNAEFALDGFDPLDFPEPVEIPLSDIFSISGKRLAAMLRQVLNAVSLDDSRRALHGVLFELEADTVRVVATDGKRINYTGEHVERLQHTQRSTIIPHHAVKKLISVFEREGSMVHVEIGEKHSEFSVPGFSIMIKVIEGNYPNYKQCIPAGFLSHIDIDRKTLLRKIEIMAGLSDYSSVLYLDFDVNRLKLSMDSGSNKYRDSMDVVGGSISKLGFRPEFILNALKSCADEKITFKINTPFDVVGIGGESFECCIMPMRSK